jgi:uncharacterized membrane protein YcaP (DUF421 family)
MWNLENPWWEYIVRSSLIYIAVFLLLRIVGKKQIGEMSPFDLVLLLIISEAVSAAITGGDNSMGAGLIAVSTFVGLNYILDVLMFKSKKIEKILDGEPQLLAANGKVNRKVQAHENITEEEIESVLREHGLDDLKDVAYAVLETNGQISIIPKGKAHKEIHNPNQDRPV